MSSETEQVCMPEGVSEFGGGVALPLDRPLSELVAEYEKGLIEAALRATRGNRSRAAKLLRTTERIIGYRVLQYGIDCGTYRDGGERTA